MLQLVSTSGRRNVVSAFSGMFPSKSAQKISQINNQIWHLDCGAVAEMLLHSQFLCIIPG
jgi:hypothetical protein